MSPATPLPAGSFAGVHSARTTSFASARSCSRASAGAFGFAGSGGAGAGASALGGRASALDASEAGEADRRSRHVEALAEPIAVRGEERVELGLAVGREPDQGAVAR